jgi:hypothetical protein
MDAKSLLILILVVAVGVLGFLYYDSQKAGVEVDIGAGPLDHQAALRVAAT